MSDVGTLAHVAFISEIFCCLPNVCYKLDGHLETKGWALAIFPRAYIRLREPLLLYHLLIFIELSLMLSLSLSLSCVHVC